MFRVDFRQFKPKFRVFVHGDGFALDFTADSPANLQNLVNQCVANDKVTVISVVADFERKGGEELVRSTETVKP